MTTGRCLWHYNLTTWYSPSLGEQFPEEFSEINPEDASRLGVKTGDRVKVISRRGEVITRVRVTDRVPPGLMYMTINYKDVPTNGVTNPVYDPVSWTAEYKVCAVRLEKVWAGGNSSSSFYYIKFY